MLGRIGKRVTRNFANEVKAKQLTAKFEELLPKKQEQLKRIKKDLGEKVGASHPGNRQDHGRRCRGRHERNEGHAV